MTVKELFEKYCSKTKEGEYVCNGHCVVLEPTTEEQLATFKSLCKKYNVEQRITDELADYYSQTNSLFNYFTCDDDGIFSWWEDDDQRSIWLGCQDDISFIYDDLDHKYAIGEAGSKDFGEYDTLMEMLESYLKYCWENGWND